MPEGGADRTPDSLRVARQPVCAAAGRKFVARVPKSVHASLTSRAKAQGISLHTLVVSLLAEGLGKKSARAQASSRQNRSIAR